MNDVERLNILNKVINAIEKDTIIPRKDEDLFGILLAEHMISNGFPEDFIDPDLLMLSIRDAFHEYSLIVETVPEPTVEKVFSKKYIEKLKGRGWYQNGGFNDEGNSDFPF